MCQVPMTPDDTQALNDAVSATQPGAVLSSNGNAATPMNQSDQVMSTFSSLSTVPVIQETLC